MSSYINNIAGNIITNCDSIYNFSVNGTYYPTPVIQTITVETANPDKIILTYDYIIDDTSVPAVTDFTPSGGKTVINVAITGKEVILTVDSVYVGGDVITLDYVVPASNMICINHGADAEAAGLTNQAVTNNIAIPLPLTGLIGQWEMNGDATDSSGNGHDLTNSNGSLTLDRNSAANKAYDLVPASSAYLYRNPFTEAHLTKFTISVWFKMDALTNLNVIIANTNLGSYAIGWGITWISTGTKLRFFLQAWNVYYAELTFNDTGSWHHLICSYKDTGTAGQQIQMSLDNGTKVYGTDFAQNPGYTGNIFVIGRGFPGTLYSDCKVDQAFLWDRELTDVEKVQVYNYYL